MKSTFVVCPVKDQWLLTRSMLDSLQAEQADDVLIIDNGSTDGTVGGVRSMQRAERWRGKLHRTAMPGHSIYEMWNAGFERARKIAAGSEWFVLITNNDITHAPGALSALVACLRSEPGAWVAYPDYDAPTHVHSAQHAYQETRGVLSDGGMLGACFMLAGHRIPWRPLITDPNYVWWWGDNHLAECIEQEGGRQLRVLGLPVEHVNEGTARYEDPNELYLKKLRDRGLWVTREARGLRAVERSAIVP